MIAPPPYGRSPATPNTEPEPSPLAKHPQWAMSRDGNRADGIRWDWAAAPASIKRWVNLGRRRETLGMGIGLSHVSQNIHVHYLLLALHLYTQKNTTIQQLTEILINWRQCCSVHIHVHVYTKFFANCQNMTPSQGVKISTVAVTC